MAKEKNVKRIWLITTNDNLNALKFYQKAVEIDPVNREGHLALAQFFREIARFTDAEAEYTKLLEINPEDIQAHLSLGLLIEGQGQYSRALKEYEEVVHLDPDNQEARILTRAIQNQNLPR